MMKFMNKYSKVICLAIIAVLLFVFFYPRIKEGFNNKIKVYESMNCGWTTKQLDYLHNKYGKDMIHFIDCNKESDKCQGITGYPVTEKDGKKHIGFNDSL